MKHRNNKYKYTQIAINDLCKDKVRLEQEIIELKTHMMLVHQQINCINNNKKNPKFKVVFSFNRKANTINKLRKINSKKEKSCLRSLSKEMSITRKRISASKKQLKQVCKILYALETKKVYATKNFKKTRTTSMQNQNHTLIIKKG